MTGNAAQGGIKAGNTEMQQAKSTPQNISTQQNSGNRGNSEGSGSKFDLLLNQEVNELGSPEVNDKRSQDLNNQVVWKNDSPFPTVELGENYEDNVQKLSLDLGSRTPSTRSLRAIKILSEAIQSKINLS